MLKMIVMKRRNYLISLYQWILNLSLILLSFILIFFLFKELFEIINDVIEGNTNVHHILGKVLSFFLYFAFISTIMTYFKESHHFPLSYLLYIGITATIRFIIVNNSYQIGSLFLSIGIVALTISYLLLTKKTEKTRKGEIEG
ncbi:phosphate-starvation-inducible protein PsiE [Priestia filamentosa]|uniref:Protein PsiE n=2 Tax=Priestia filamentosa TaxID=1402861 RepID=A0A1X7EM68_9BACI|nr:phosphate-starvation-inducible PsiE family protein [Priestia filamentosa]AKO93159.1 phosphate-starvation-inducible protein PsiE [Priestia filamentosa]MDT3763293.1 phosphate-starvation-inducible PsiE family protein [Priestia filamentosa]OXS69797.1 phosphate-starvation-inducible protein PsiE [Priestia filamentosa]RJS63545.1 phosphate-starvation-inducible protein PsiE [Priestia filamentosa]WRU93759.1 phosphate-starvation-inducible PsiE family protein [Priestia filamentosa]